MYTCLLVSDVFVTSRSQPYVHCVILNIVIIERGDILTQQRLSDFSYENLLMSLLTDATDLYNYLESPYSYLSSCNVTNLKNGNFRKRFSVTFLQF